MRQNAARIVWQKGRSKSSHRIAYRHAHRDEVNARSRQWRLDNPEKAKAYSLKYQDEHRNELRSSEDLARITSQVTLI